MGNWASSSVKKGGGNQVLDSDLDLRDKSVDEGMKEVWKNSVFKQTSYHNYAVSNGVNGLLVMYSLEKCWVLTFKPMQFM